MSFDDIGARIFVGGLDHNCDEAILEKTFRMFGEITQILIMKDRETKRSRGFGFISFVSQTAAEDAIRRMHGVEVMGRCVTVRKAEKQANMVDRPRRGGFRGGGRGGDGDRGYGSSFQSKFGEGRGKLYDNDRTPDGYHDKSRYGISRGRNSDYGVSSKDATDSSRHGYRSGYDEMEGRNSFVDSRAYGDPARSSDISGVHPSRGNYEELRRTATNDMYADSRREEYSNNSRSYNSGMTRDSFDSENRYQSRGRSRSPIERYSYRKTSPVPPRGRKLAADNSYSRIYPESQIQRHIGREYSPMSSGGKAFSQRDGYAQESRGYTSSSYRDSSPSHSGRGRVRDSSPARYAQTRRDRAASPPRQRGSQSNATRYIATRSRSPVQRNEYSSNASRSQVSSNRGTGLGIRYDGADMSVKRRLDQGTSTGTHDHRPGYRTSYQENAEIPTVGSSRYSSRRQGGSSPNARSSYPRGLKQLSRKSPSPKRRDRY